MKPETVAPDDPVVFIPIPEPCLQLIASGQRVVLPGLDIAEGALPPPHVAIRSLRLLEAGCPPEWAIPLNIVDGARQVVVGGVGFKGQPLSGVVEIGYAVAPSCHRRGFATAAVRHAQAIAARAGTVREVIALVAPGNLASAGVLARSSFTMGPEILDADGERVVRWHWACETGSPQHWPAAGSLSSSG
ncbi:MAG: GNAT family N-acetyltransferase [Pseudomonadota bacterium]|nr:GNAT family N-acetyltransferase [Pseudomonadota bacterium]MDQ3161159.1 GNAT family N-acetyltransferase [Pseudomonadota bacterium]